MRKKLLGLFDSDLVYMERFYGFLKDSRIPFNVVAFTDVEALMGQNGKEVPDYLVVSEDYLNKVDNFPGVKIGIFEERNPRGLYRYSPADENLKTLVKLLQISESDYGLGNATSTKFIGVLTKVPEEVGAQLLLLTWACLEAVTDVRTLLNGGKTEVIKDAKDFNVSLNGLVSGQLFLTGNSEVGDDLPSSETEDSSNISFKLSYEDYLRIFLYLMLCFLNDSSCIRKGRETNTSSFCTVSCSRNGDDIMSGNFMNKYRKANMTVECALLMPTILAVTIILVKMTIYMYDRAVMENALVHSVMAADYMQDASNNELKNEMEIRIEEELCYAVALEDIDVSVTVKENVCKAEITGKLNIGVQLPGTDFFTETKARISKKRLSGTETVRNVRKIEKLVQLLSEETSEDNSLSTDGNGGRIESTVQAGIEQKYDDY